MVWQIEDHGFEIIDKLIKNWYSHSPMWSDTMPQCTKSTPHLGSLFWFNGAITIQMKWCAVEGLGSRSIELGLNELGNKVQYYDNGSSIVVEKWCAV